MFRLFQILLQWAPSKWILTCTHNVLSTDFLGTTRCSRLILNLPCPNLEISQVSKTLTSFSGNWCTETKVWLLGKNSENRWLLTNNPLPPMSPQTVWQNHYCVWAAENTGSPFPPAHRRVEQWVGQHFWFPLAPKSRGTLQGGMAERNRLPSPV